MSSFDFAREAYLSLNDELTEMGSTYSSDVPGLPQPTRDEFDSRFVVAADEYAELYGLPKFDVLRDVDEAARLVEAAERRANL